MHLASRTHFVDLVIHDICSQKIMPYFHKWSSSIRNFAQWSTFCLSFLTLFFCSISFPSFYPLDFFFFQQFFSLRTLFTIFSWLLFLENMRICIVQILSVFCLHGLHYEKTSFWSRHSCMQGMLGVPQFWVKIIFGWNLFGKKFIR